MMCGRCGYTLQIGDFPFCKGRATDHVPGRYGVITDDVPGGLYAQHGIGVCEADGSPKRYDSKSALLKAARAAGWTNYVRHIPPPGTDKSPLTTRWI